MRRRNGYVSTPSHELASLDIFRKTLPPAGYPSNIRRLYAPIDDVHGALLQLIKATRQSLVLAMYGFDDEELAAAIRAKLLNPSCYVQMTLDATQAAGVHEKKLLAGEDYPATNIAIGHSEHAAIMHLKLIVIDGWLTIGGSTNWSASAETKQDNEMTIIADPYIAAESRARIDAIHANILAKAAK